MTIQQINPIFRSFDETKAKEFYVDYLGFKVTFEHRFDPDAPLYLGLQLPPDDGKEALFELHLSEHHGDACPGSTIRIQIDNIDALHETLASKKYKYARPSIEQQPWGFREVKVTDPFGNKIIFCQPS
ncbi:Glyoxalase Bleomycin resistance protein (Dioxygenase) [Seminavis robusta]|uniref:Bleomycin resistance protein n=1 Tax=Seminavis robusta TaxID=568900 RepID=A0A9N8EFS6_9STRA|nr:Glyoxalase Bleomycin resistance protein (Dioxygenase) [Seminavis robusta]|eukprot:Sro935_g221990.1 Glyoxalase Bleomycin resistance protein (Dioxygenase (128) ;mRNA; r:24099-24482